MKKSTMYYGLAAGALVVAGVAATMPGATAAASGSGQAGARPTVRVCPTSTKPGFATCLAVAVAGPNGKPLLSSTPTAAGFSPAQIEAAYNLTGLQAPKGTRVVIVDATGYPNIESDLAKYRSNYSLPACTVANGCFTLLNQRGGTTPPKRVVGGWDVEQALDVDAVSAICPNCDITMIEANDGNLKNLAIAENLAAKQPGVAAISNSYIFSYTYDHRRMHAYNHPGIAITAGTGDAGYQGGGYPADDPHVVGVSGTSLYVSDNDRGYTESAWSGTGSGCAESPRNFQPAWQKSIDTTCTTKAVGDVSAAADPNNGGLDIVINGSFEQVGGTSEATPIIAAVYALSGNTKGYPAKYPYEHPGDLYDITTGSNGSCGAPLCQAGKGWDGVTGMGTPDGVKGF